MIKVVEYKKPQGMQPEDLITYGLYADTKAEVNRGRYDCREWKRASISPLVVIFIPEMVMSHSVHQKIPGHGNNRR